MCDPNKETAVYSTVQDFAEGFFAPFPASLPVAFGGTSHIGNVRTRNEDHFAVLKLRRTTEFLITSLVPEDQQAPETCSYVLVVADGMGGMKSGEFASRLALQTMVELAGQATSWVMRLVNVDAQQIEQRVQAYVQLIHATLQTQGRSNPALTNMGTTWTSAHLLGNNVVIVHLGDSRAYLFRDGELRQLTRDETMAESLIESGMEPSRVRRFRNILLNSFGGGNDSVSASIYHLELTPNDHLVLCTDGLYSMVTDEDIASELSRHTAPQSACDALVKRALENGGKDNVTVVSAWATRTMPAENTE